MIVKSLSRKNKSFGELVKYIDKKSVGDQYGVFHNLKVFKNNPKLVSKEFRKNSDRCLKRKNGVYLYHDILSFSDRDTNRLTPEIMQDLASRYIELRANNSLAYGKIHLDTECPHVHLMISGNLLGSAKKTRISKAKFKQIKIELERYQKSRYPFLEHSLVFERGRKEKSQVVTTE